jgi:hypothetical protein
MKNHADVIALLGTLSDSDRTWIIGKLPAHAKSRLLAAGADRNSTVSAAPKTPSLKEVVEPTNRASFDALARAQFAQIVQVLRGEPAWLIAVLLSAHEWTWQAELLTALSPAVRSDVAHVQRSAGAFSAHLVDTLMRLIAERVSGGTLSHRPSRFESLVERVRASRSKRRLSLHL